MRQVVVFIDGPTGVGKDFFINNLATLHRKESPKSKIKVVRATDVVLDSVTETENRKYTAYDTSVDKQQMMFDGHISLLQHIKDTLSDPIPPDLLLVNRSFLSFINYNAHDSIIRAKYTANYCKEHAAILGDVCTILVKLEVPYQEVLLSRVRSRNDGKPINENWIETIHDRYKDIPDELTHQFDFYVTTDSGGHREFYDSYLRD